VPLYEFACRSCGHRFEELVATHVGTAEAAVRCPECGGGEPQRLVSSSFAATHRQMTPNQRRRSEDKRGTGRGGAMERFRKQRAAEKRRSGPGGGGG
jgi:putative FmdB family regulatory protein